MIVRKEGVGRRSDAVNAGLRVASNELVCMIDADSILDTVSDFAKKILPEQTHAKIDEVRDQVDGAVGQ